MSDMDVEETIIDLCKRMESASKLMSLIIVIQGATVLWMLLLTWSA